MLSVLDRHIQAWHFWVTNALAVAWFAGMSYATQTALPGVKLEFCRRGLRVNTITSSADFRVVTHGQKFRTRYTR